MGTKQNRDYSERLQDPRWQRRRLEIFQRDDFTCQVCGCKDKQLEVHHLWYDPEANEIWNYRDSALITLCHSCHQREHECEANVEMSLRYLRRQFLNLEIEEMLTSITYASDCVKFKKTDIVTLLSRFCDIEPLIGYDALKRLAKRRYNIAKGEYKEYLKYLKNKKNKDTEKDAEPY